MHMQNFKRFTELTITDVPESAKLVVLVGPNGCGKSSVFDAFTLWHREQTGLGHSGDNEYYIKGQVGQKIHVELHDGTQPARNSLYVRTAYRNDADFRSNRIETQPSPVENPRFHRLIDDDKSVSGNYQRLLLDSIGKLYSEESKKKLGEQITDELVGDVRTSLVNIFGDLSLNTIAEPLGSDQGQELFTSAKEL